MVPAPISVQTENFLNSEVICDDFFISIVERNLKITRDQFKLKLVLLFPNSGNNTSMVFRANLKIEHKGGRKESVQANVKALLERATEFQNLEAFQRERIMYEGVITDFQQIWKSAGVDVRFGPKSIKFETDPHEILVLEDLMESGYVMGDCTVGVDLSTAKSVLSKLAKFHAASAVRFETDGVILKSLDRESLMFPTPPEGKPNLSYKLNENMIKALYEAVNSWGPDYKIYAEKIQRWNYVKMATGYMNVAEPMKCGLRVLNHGNLFVSRFMVKYDEKNNPVDVLLNEFTMCFWGSPSCDLLYFLISSLNDDIKVENFNDLIKYYHTELVSGLKMLHYKNQVPSLEDLHIDLLENGSFGASCLLIILFISKYNSKKEITIAHLFRGGKDTEELFEIMYHNENYAKACKKWLPFMNEYGFLDSLI